ncbi:complement factor H-like isoform X2 [Oryzias latipes]
MKLWLTLLTFQLLNLLQVSLSQNEVTCDPPQITHGRVTDRPKVYKENHYLTFVCDTNYKPADERRSRCIKVGSEAVWSPTPQCLPILCKVNLPPIQGTTFNRYDRNMFSPGDTLTVTCEGDRWIVDMKTTRTAVTCKDNGEWDITPECQDIRCHEDRRDRYLYSFYVPWGQRKINGRATYSCRHGYEKPRGVTHAICTRDGWMPERLCEGTTCSRPDFEHGEQITSGERTSYSNGDRLTYECVYPNDRISVTITCDRGSWSGIKSCLEVTCDPPQIAHGRVTDRPKVYKEDEYLTFVCDDNYKPADERRSRCFKVGSEAVWSPTPQCLLIQCKVNLPPIQGTTFNRYDRNMFSPGDTLTVTCEGDRWIVDMKTTRTAVTCKDNGEWDIRPECKDVRCHEDRRDRYLYSFDPQWEAGKPSGRATYSCRRGYEKPRGVTHAICTRDGWMPERLCEGTTCSRPDFEHGEQITSRERTFYSNGDRLTYECVYPNDRISVTITCDRGSWSGIKSCLEVTCDPPQIAHGRVTDRPKVYKEDEYLTFVCDDNYKPADERRSRCFKVGSEAVWSPTPQCLLIQCKVNLPPIQGTTFNRYDRNMFSPGDTLTVTCEGDRWIVDMKTTRTAVTCKDNGEWDIRPECKDVRCHEDRRDRYLYSFYPQWEEGKPSGRATYSCRRGYEKPRGVTHAICTRDGWMPERLCEGTTCSRPDFEHGEQITSRERTFYNNGDRLTYECVPPNDRISVTITCDRGSWSGIKSCLDLACVKPVIPNGFSVGPYDNTVYYSCNQNYKLFSKAWWGVAKCNKGVWSELQKCIEMTECGETPDISNGRVESKDNQRATINCNEGYQTEVNEITCDNGEWDLDERNYTNICTRISEPCEPPPKVQNAVIETPYQREYVSGSQVIYKCRDNYRLGQDKSITCLNGQWEEKRISCTPFCDELKDDNLNVQQSIKESYMNGETIDYTCTYDEDNQGTATCDEGKWNKTIQCPGRPCNVPKLGPGLRSSPTTFKVKSGRKLSLYCLSEFELEGANEIECLDTGLWSSAFPTCTKTCEMPNIPQILRLMTPVEGGRAKKGKKLRFECSQRGKFLQGNAEIECLESGDWSDQPPRCGDKRLCSPPPPIEDGDIMRTKPEYQEGETVEYVCPSYYIMEGGPLTCRNGQWTGRVRCISRPCNVPKLGPGLRSSPTTFKVKSGRKLSLYCLSEFELEGANEIECLDTGLWSSAFPTCTKTCEMPNIPQILRLMTPVEGGRAKKGKKLRFECSQRGKFLQGNAEIECLESGDWSDQPPRCGDKRLCSPPPPIEDGDIMRTKPEYQEGETVEYVCPSYYIMEGGPLTCRNGQWTGRVRCINKRLCSPPPPIEDGDIMRTKPEYQEGETVEYVCPSYYIMEGGPLTCRNGQWTGRVRCIKPCTMTQEEMDRNNLVLQKDWLDKIYSQHNDHLTFKCKSGKRHDGRVAMRQQCIEGVIQLPTCV